MSGTKAWCSKLLPLQGLLVALVAVGIYPSWGFAEHGDTEIRKNFLTSKLTFNQKPDLGKPVTVTYTIQATADGLQDLEIHLEVGRVYVNSGMGPVRHDVVMVGNGTQQTRTISLPSLRKGESYSTTFMVQIPNVSLKDLKRVMAYPIEAPAIAAVWTSYKLPDGRPSYVCSWGELNGRVEVADWPPSNWTKKGL
jgi:hypothetical protein